MTGADPAAFADIAPRAEMFEISPGRATRGSRVRRVAFVAPAGYGRGHAALRHRIR